MKVELFNKRTGVRVIVDTHKLTQLGKAFLENARQANNEDKHWQIVNSFSK